jgi:hypothetical protein
MLLARTVKDHTHRLTLATLLPETLRYAALEYHIKTSVLMGMLGKFIASGIGALGQSKAMNIVRSEFKAGDIEILKPFLMKSKERKFGIHRINVGVQLNSRVVRNANNPSYDRQMK